MKKIVTILLSFLLLLSLVPLTAFAESVTITGIEFPDYHVYDCSNLYQFPIPDFTVHYSDGSSEVVTEEMTWEGDFDWNIDDLCPFALGTQTLNISYNGFDTTANLIVHEFPFVSFEIEDIVAEQYNNNYGDDNGDYFIYTNNEYNFVFKDGDGTEFPMTSEELYYGYCVTFTRFDDTLSEMQQTSELQPGVYYPTLEVGPLSASYKYTLNEFPIASFSVPDCSVEEYDIYNGDWVPWDDYGEPIENPYFRYYEPFDYVTITYKNGDVEQVECSDIYELGYIFYTNIDELQTEETPFLVGEHTINCSIGPLSTTYTLTIVEQPLNPLPVSERLDYYVYAYYENGDDWDYCQISKDLIKLNYNPKSKRIDVTLKTEKEYIAEGHTYEEFINLLTGNGYIEDPSKWQYEINMMINAPVSKNNPLTMVTDDMEKYGMVYVKLIDDIDAYLKDPSAVEYEEDWPYAAEIALLTFKTNIADNHVTYEKVEEEKYGAVWKAEKPIEDVYTVTFYLDGKSPETLVVDYSVYVAAVALIILGIFFILSRKSKTQEK